MLNKLQARLRALLRPSQVEQEFEEEIRFHIERQTEQNLRLGMSPQEARLAARRSFGGVEQAKELSRDARGVRWLGDGWQDLRYGLRMLLKNPGFTFIAVLTLALGIGANTAIFSVVYAVLLSPLRYGQPESLVALYAKNQKKGLLDQPIAYANFKEWRAESKHFAQLAAVRSEPQILTGRGDAERLNGIRVTTNTLSLLGVQPILGRDFRPEEEQPEKGLVALLGYGVWQRHFGGTSAVLGQSLLLNGRAYTIIGVLPAWLKYPGIPIPPAGADIWIPLRPSTDEANRRFAFMRVMGKLNPDMSVAQAQAEMTGFAARQERDYPDINTSVEVEVKPLHEVLTGKVRLGLWILLGAVGLVLLIACVNVANLLLARAAGRQGELAIRTALGASRGRIMRQLLTECVLLSVAGSLFGLLLAYQGLQLLTRTNAGNLPRVEEIHLNGFILAFTLLLSVLTTMLFGLLPAWRTSRIHLVTALKEGRKGTTGNLLNRRWLEGLIVAEISLALILLVGAGLLIRSFRAVSEVDPGFQTQNRLTLSLPLSATDYPDQSAQLRFYEEALGRVKTVPGVQNVAAVSRLPMIGLAGLTFTMQGQAVQPGAKPDADYFTISPSYFRTLGLPLLQGREFDEHDTAASADVVVINEELARRYWPAGDAIGKRLQLASETTRWREVVGIVGNARLSGLETKIDPAIYVPLAQNWWANVLRNSYLIVHTQTDPASLVPALRQVLHSIDAGVPVTQVRTMDDIVADKLAPRRFNMSLLLGFAVIAAVLASVGIYGVMSYSIAQRTNEIGVRMALGGKPLDILKLVLGDSAKLTALGLLLGIAGALGLTRLMTSLLFGVSPYDPLTFCLIPLLLALVAFLACYLPARRATKVDPLRALRHE